MKNMETRIILSHIVFGAKPCYEQKVDNTAYDDEEVTNKSKKNKRKRKINRLK